MEPPKRIVVTGAAGWTAEPILAALAGHGHRVAGLDLPASRPAPHASEWIAGSVADLPTVQRAARSADALIHLAVATGDDDYQQPEVPFAVNVLGTYNVLEAARRERVPKVVLISSAAVHLPPVPGRRMTASQWRSSPGGDHLYDLTKRLQEETARDFCQTFGMTAIVLRAGHVVDSRAGLDPAGRPLAGLRYCRGGWLCRYDLAAGCLHALGWEGLGYHAFHLIGSLVARAHFDLDRTERELGFRPHATFAQYE